MDLDNKKHLMIIGAFIALLAMIYYVVFIMDTKVGATYNPCRHNQCITPVPTAVPSVTLVPTVTVAPTVEPTITETPTATPSPTNTPENKQDVSDGRSDGRSDGLCSKPPCVDNRSGVPLYKETINK